MNYQEFMENIFDEIRYYLPEEYQSASIEINPVVKNNDTVLHALMIRRDGSNICPSIYLNDLYEKYNRGMELSAVFSEIAEMQLAADRMQVPDVSMIYDYAQCKDRIFCKLINAESNQQYLQDKPFTLYEDLAITYHVLVSNDHTGIGSAVITNRLMEMLGVDVEKLHEAALSNMVRLFPTQFRSVDAILLEQFMHDPDILRMSETEKAGYMKNLMTPDSQAMYCLSNSTKMFGAAAILRKENLDMVAKQVGGDFYVLPSSVHEVIVIPKKEDSNYQNLEAMVREINHLEVLPEEKLSDHVYEYDSRERVLMRSDKAEQRKNTIEKAREKGETKKPLKNVLAEKKEDALSKQMPFKRNCMSERSL